MVLALKKSFDFQFKYLSCVIACMLVTAHVFAFAQSSDSEKTSKSTKTVGKAKDGTTAFPQDSHGDGESEESPELDESIKIIVEPVVRGLVVDRVTESATVFVKSPGIKTVFVYLEPVDAPYGGKSLAEPKLIGKSTDKKHDFPIVWSSSEPYSYVKIFALCVRDDNTETFFRSRALDLGLAGQRLQTRTVQPDNR